MENETMTVSICDSGWADTWGESFDIAALCEYVQSELQTMGHIVAVDHGETNGLSNRCTGNAYMNDEFDVVGLTDDALCQLVDDIIADVDMEQFCS